MERLDRENSSWQAYVTQAYSLWGKLDHLTYINLINICEPNRMRPAVLLSCLNSQVLNGGFSQWWGNDYATHIDEIIKFLTEIDTTSSLSVVKIVNEFCTITGPYIDLAEVDDDDWPQISDSLLAIDRLYYDVYQQLELDIEAWLKTRTAKFEMIVKLL